MKHVYVILIVLVVALAKAQAPTWNGLETQKLLASCILHHTDSVVCVATDGMAFSYQGAKFVKLTP